MSSYLLGGCVRSPLVIELTPEVTGLSRWVVAGASDPPNTPMVMYRTPMRRSVLASSERDCRRVLADLALDRAGFIRTDAQLQPENSAPPGKRLGVHRCRLKPACPPVFRPSETSVGSLKTCGLGRPVKGAARVRSIHAALGHPIEPSRVMDVLNAWDTAIGAEKQRCRQLLMDYRRCRSGARPLRIVPGHIWPRARDQFDRVYIHRLLNDGSTSRRQVKRAFGRRRGGRHGPVAQLVRSESAQPSWRST